MWRQNEVATSFWRNNDVIMASYVRLDVLQGNEYEIFTISTFSHARVVHEHLQPIYTGIRRIAEQISVRIFQIMIQATDFGTNTL